MKRTGNKKVQPTYTVRGNAWERQDWDTDTSYAYFSKHFLTQSAPRVLDVGYRDWAKTTGKYSDVSDLRATTTWRRWCNVRNRKDQRIVGALTWWERAQAYDDHRLGRWDEEILTKQQRQTETEIRRWDKLGEHVDNLLSSVQMFRKAGTKKILHPTTGDEVYIDTLELNVSDYKNIAGLMRELNQGMRLALGMPERIVEAQHSGTVSHTVVGLADDMKPIFDAMKQYEDDLTPTNIIDMKKDA